MRDVKQLWPAIGIVTVIMCTALVIGLFIWMLLDIQDSNHAYDRFEHHCNNISGTVHHLDSHNESKLICIRNNVIVLTRDW